MFKVLSAIHKWMLHHITTSYFQELVFIIITNPHHIKTKSPEDYFELASFQLWENCKKNVSHVMLFNILRQILLPPLKWLEFIHTWAQPVDNGSEEPKHKNSCERIFKQKNSWRERKDVCTVRDFNLGFICWHTDTNLYHLSVLYLLANFQLYVKTLKKTLKVDNKQLKLDSSNIWKTAQKWTSALLQEIIFTCTFLQHCMQS